MTQFFIIFILAYLIGSINFSILLFKILRFEDPREKFSGNPGTTNVYRQAGIFWAAAVLLLDVGRAIGLAAFSVHFLSVEYVPWIGFSLIFGNRFPCFHQFKGGKGVANYLGFTAIITPVTAGLSAVIWVIVYGIVRTPFVASFFMIATLGVGSIIAFNYTLAAIIGTTTIVIFIFFNHRKNIIEKL